MLYEAILFDFDGVLADSEPVHFECWQEILRTYDLDLDWNTYRDHGIGVSDRKLLALVCERAQRPADLELLIAEFPHKKDLFRARMLERQPFSAEIFDLLPELSDYQLGLVTSSGQGEIEPVLEKAGLRDFFNAVVYGGDVQQHKPAPDPYLLAVAKLGVRTALAIEDSNAGETSARAAGLDVLRVPTPAEMPAMLRDRLGFPKAFR
ncbi:MAG TPA: HAD-IA family hydrolase [Bryobacteraceae bacterium]|nr:HAD-IA family hydrolase [Bryobacteraceae bacterium]